jgi:hypothetical protein
VLPFCCFVGTKRHFGVEVLTVVKHFLSAHRKLVVLSLVATVAALVFFPFVAAAQDTGYISGTVLDKSGAAVVGAEVLLTNLGKTLRRTTVSNDTGAYVIPGLPGDTYNLTVSAKGFQKFTASKIVLNVAEKARIDVTMTIGAVNEEIVVTGESIAQVETQSSDLSGTVSGKQITQLQLNGRNFVQLATIVPGVSNQTGQDEAQVGVNGSVHFSMNGGRTEYNNWEFDGGDNMDNGSNGTLNVYPSIDAIAEFKVLTSNYGAQYGRNGSGTVEVETKSGTQNFHGDVYYFGRNDAMNARNFFDDKTQPTPKFKKHDFGYTIGGPVYIPHVYNESKQKTFFFWSQEWRKDLVPGQNFHQAVPSMAERGGNFTDVCTNPNFSSTDCPNVPDPAHVAVDPNAAALLTMIPEPTTTDPTAAFANCGGIACYNASPAQSTDWREELIRVDHNFNSKWRATVRYIHDSWNTEVTPTLWSGYTFPTITTGFVGPGTSFVTRLNTEISPTLFNEFVASYTADHIFLTPIAPGVPPRSQAAMTATSIFPYAGENLPDISLTGNKAFGDFSEGFASYSPWNNANPTYTFRDNLSKIYGRHTFQMGAYAVVAQKNEQSSVGTPQGTLSFKASNSVVGTGNAFADLLLGRIDTYSQVNLAPKYYFRYEIVEPYFNDDWRITTRLTLNLGLRVSLFGTYREKYKQAYNFEPSVFKAANAPFIDDGTVTGTEGALLNLPPSNPAAQALSINDPRNFNGVVQCGATGTPGGCVNGHVFNPAPRIGFAWDPWGDGKWAIRGGYGIFFEHGNGNEQNVESLEATPPLVLNPSQPNITGYTNIGSGGGTILAFPLGFNAIATKSGWPYVQQWNLNVQHQLPQHFIASVAYVGSKGTHLGRQFDINQVVPVPISQNPYKAGEAIGPNDCTNLTTPSGVPITGQALVNLGIACGNDPNPYRPYTGFRSMDYLQFGASSSYNSLQILVTRQIAPLTLSVAYTYSHSIDDASEGAWGGSYSYLDTYDLARARASSNFDQRHMLNISYVYDLPFFKSATGWTNMLMGGWQWAGVTSIQTGTPFDVIDSSYSDNAGVSNGSSPGSFVDIVGNAHSTPSPACIVSGTGPQLFNPCAFAHPRGLTFGDAGRNLLHNPRVTNFDMSLLKQFRITEATHLEFRAEAFNIFNHTEWNGVFNDLNSPAFLHPSSAHRARTLQLGLKFLF